MSARSLEDKKRRRVAKELRDPLPAWIDLVDYVKMRVRCSTGTAEKVLLLGALHIDGEAVGFVNTKRLDGSNYRLLQPYLPAEFRDRIRIKNLKELEEEAAAND